MRLVAFRKRLIFYICMGIKIIAHEIVRIYTIDKVIKIINKEDSTI